MRTLLAQAKKAMTAAPLAYRPGHYYSPICDSREIRARYVEPSSLHLAGDAPAAADQVGCGLSSASILDTIDAFSLPTVCTFIDPDLSRLKVEQGHRHTFMQMPIQNAPLTLFDELATGDVLLIDSTHVAKTGSDFSSICSKCCRG
jgi:hypothetical protein